MIKKNLYILLIASINLYSCKNSTAPQLSVEQTNESTPHTAPKISEKISEMTMPDIALSTPEEKTIKLSDFKGKYLFVDFWAYWCGPCRQEIPHLKELHKKYKNNSNIEFISVSIDLNKKQWLKAIAKDTPTWTQLIVNNEEDLASISNFWTIEAIPHGILIDPQGKTISNGLRSAEELEELLKNKIKL